MRREARDSARQEAEAIAGRARAEVEREARRSLDELKLTVANLAVRISREVLTEELDPGKHEKLADEFIERLKTARASREVRDR
jgi:F0F1-type ATP synthase membrane subunit b/b'